MGIWESVRRDFPITRSFTYLDHASAAPVPRPVREAALRYWDELGRSSDFSWNRWMSRREEVRQKVARLIQADPDEIAFTTSTSHGMNLVAELIALEGEVLTNTLEFPATTVPWIHRRSRLKFLSPERGILTPERI